MAQTDVSLAVSKLIEEFRKAGAPPAEQDFNRLAAQISNGFKAKKDEVAILRLSPDGKVLNFLFPIRLAVVGAIPVTTEHSLAAKTIRQKQGELVNDFAAYKHPTVFEAIKLSEQEKATPIQKIMSSPMIVDGNVMGVIQISRKGYPGEKVGPDFTPADLDKLGTVGTILGKFLAAFPPAPLASPRSPSKD